MTQTILGLILHPEYSFMSNRWREWRLCYESGQYYIDNYLQWFKYEKKERYNERKAMTYVPAFAKEGVNEVRNAVWGRLNDVQRSGGDESYAKATVGLVGGVDRRRSAMNDFIGRIVLPEMLTMRRIGVWVDMPALAPGITKASLKPSVHPYLCWYPVESIRSWSTDEEGKLTRVLLKQSNFGHDEATGLPMSGNVDSYRLAWIGDPDKEEPGVHVREEIGADKEMRVKEYVLDLDEIPFFQFEIEHSLLEDVCGHQRALLNIESSDVAWITQANFPIWTQQNDSKTGSQAIRAAQQQNKPPIPRPGTDFNSMPIVPGVPAGQAKEAQDAKSPEVTVGPTTGIGYPAGLERPGFVNPSSEPLTASMAKQLAIKEDIRRLLHLSVATLDPQMASAESKDMDDRGLQNGLQAIAAALKKGEQAIAHFWSAYMGGKEAHIEYPLEWSMQTESGRRKDAKELIELRDEVPSTTFRKTVAKQVASKLVGHKVAPEVLEKVYSEIDAAEYVSANIDDVALDIQSGVLSKATGSVIRGYPEDEAEKAVEEQAEQLRITAISQTPGGGMGAAADPARGGLGHPADPGSKAEKAADATKTGVHKDNTRGEGK